jgi:hypothetical protein
MTASAFVTQLKTIFNDQTVADATVEDLVDAVIDELNLQGCSLSNMSGSAGSKTITLTSAQKGAVRRIFRVIYSSWHKHADNQTQATTGAISAGFTDLMSNPTVQAMIKDTAAALKNTSPPIYVANDPIEG